METTTSQQSGIKILEDDVRESIRLSSIDPLEDQQRAKAMIDEAIASYEKRMFRGTLPMIHDFEQARTYLVNLICGFGSLQPLLDDPGIEEIWINSPTEIFVARSGESELTGLVLDDEQVRLTVERMLKMSGRRLDLSSPFVDSSLPGLSIVL